MLRRRVDRLDEMTDYLDVILVRDEESSAPLFDEGTKAELREALNLIQNIVIEQGMRLETEGRS